MRTLIIKIGEEVGYSTKSTPGPTMRDRVDLHSGNLLA